MKKFFIKTLGCKSNQLEAAVMREKLIAAGYKQTSKIDEADIFIMNSCSVTETADVEALRVIRNIKNKNSNVTSVLTGCSAQLNSEKLMDLPYVDIVLGNDDKFDIVQMLESHCSKVTDIFELKSFNNQLIHDYFNTRGFLKIQDGCNNYCSYCTIPFARGKSRSNSVENIIEQVKIYTDNGIKEVVLTGIHIGQWGVDFDEKRKILHLLEKIEDTNIIRYRLGSLNPLEIDDELLGFLSQSEKFCPHFHLSLQSLNDAVLRRMNRNYSAETCLDLMDRISSLFKLPFIGSDIIVGFPGETDADFEITVENVKKSKLSNVHVFPYSVRKNTAAASMENQVPEQIKHNRADILHKIVKEKYFNFLKCNQNTTHQALIEKRPDKKTGMLKAVTENYLTVLLPNSSENLYNTIQNVTVAEIDYSKLQIKAELNS